MDKNSFRTYYSTFKKRIKLHELKIQHNIKKEQQKFQQFLPVPLQNCPRAQVQAKRNQKYIKYRNTTPFFNI